MNCNTYLQHRKSQQSCKNAQLFFTTRLSDARPMAYDQDHPRLFNCCTTGNTAFGPFVMGGLFPARQGYSRNTNPPSRTYINGVIFCVTAADIIFADETFKLAPPDVPSRRPTPSADTGCDAQDLTLPQHTPQLYFRM